MYRVKKTKIIKSDRLKEIGFKEVGENVYRLRLKNPDVIAVYSRQTLYCYADSGKAIDVFMSMLGIKRYEKSVIHEKHDDKMVRFTNLFSIKTRS